MTKTVSDSQVTLSQVVFPKDTDELHHAPAGYILKLIDIVASLASRKHTCQKPVTASMDVMNFANPILEWDLVSATAHVTQVWNSSQEVQVIVTAQDYYAQHVRHIAQGFLTFVSLDDDMKPTRAPVITFETEAERLMAQGADLRRQNRILERQHSKDRSIIAIDETDTIFEISRLMTPDDANIYHNVFGGVILEQTHEVAKKAAQSHTKTLLTTVRQDRMNFEQPAVIGEILEAQAVITRTWGSSLEVMVEVSARENQDASSSRVIANSYLVFVALDNSGSPLDIPNYTPETPKQKLRWEQAQLRRTIRQDEIKTLKALKT